MPNSTIPVTTPTPAIQAEFVAKSLALLPKVFLDLGAVLVMRSSTLPVWVETDLVALGVPCASARRVLVLGERLFGL